MLSFSFSVLFLKLSNSDVLLDYGVGLGFITEHLHQFVAKTYCYDTDHRMLHYCNEKFINEEAAKPESERMEAVSVLTPNFLHFPMAKKLLENGFNVICEKPLTTSLEEAKELEALQKNIL